MDEISISRHVGDATMLSMPLAYASTLDRSGVNAAARVIVEAFWSRALARAP
jgi:hypothetical protein